MIGKTLGHYKIVEHLGRGGMGEVYLADDTILDRKVALKFLPDIFTGDPERMARFEREAKLLASLNHPNIAAIYGLEQADGKRFLIMEYVKGETLQAKIGKGALPLEEALALCRQIAEGLEAAHEKGVIHRDLKPANVMITTEEKVKILDFGLAKALLDEKTSVDSSQSPTITEAMTRPGVVLGTAAYMSPEQAKGKAVDKRADIWAFGCILYECLTAKRVFEEETVTETLAAVIKEPPDLERIPAKTRFLLRRCLEKDPKKRLRDIGEAMVLIEAFPESALEPTTVKRPKLLWIWAAAATLLVLALAAPAFLYFHSREPSEARVFDITVPRMPSEYSMAISPNGRWIVFTAFSSGSIPCLFVRNISSVTPAPIEGTEGAIFPFWSPDSQSIGFFAGGTLKRVAVSGGSPQDVCPVGKPIGGTWNTDGVIVFSDYPILRRVTAEGGESIPITALDRSRKEFAHVLPHFLPDGHHYLYVASSGTASRHDIYLRSISTKKQIRLLNARKAVYAEPGYLLFQRDKTLFAQPFDPDKLEFSGEPLSIAENLLFSNELHGSADFGVAETGLLVYRSAAVESGFQFVWFDRTGKQLGPAGEPSTLGPAFDLSPDGKSIAGPRYDSATKSDDIWKLEWERDLATRLTFDPALDVCVAWSPDGLRIGFSSNRNGNMDIFVKDATGMGEETVLVDSAEDEWLKDWSKDGQYIAYGSTNQEGVCILPLFGDRKPFSILQSPFALNMPSFSYDVKWLAYNSDESGIPQVYVTSFPATDQRRQVSISGGAQPRWKDDGKELYYLSLDGKMTAVDIGSNAGIEAGKPHILFDTGLIVDPTNNQYEVTADGRRFLVLKPLGKAASIPITVVVDWTALLR
jgi:serine/threonine protein kinase